MMPPVLIPGILISGLTTTASWDNLARTTRNLGYTDTHISFTTVYALHNYGMKPTVATSTPSSTTRFPIVIKRTTKRPPPKRSTPTTSRTTTIKTVPFSHTVVNLSTTTKLVTARPPPPAPAVSGSGRSGGCGLPQIKKFCPKARIVNGTQSCYGQFPWQVIKEEVP